MRFFCLIVFCAKSLFIRYKVTNIFLKKQVFVGCCFFEKKILSLQVKLGEVCFFAI